jgi:hypothetical protein
MIKPFKFLTKYEYHRFTPYCCYDNAKFIIETLISTDEWETTIFPKEYPHENGVWRVLYIQRGRNNYHSVVCHEPINPGYIIERFIVNIDL